MSDGAANKPQGAVQRPPAVTAPGSVERSAAALASPVDPSGEGRQGSPSSRVMPDGRYRILDEIGRGGIGRVRRARDLRLDRVVALKDVLSREGG